MDQCLVTVSHGSEELWSHDIDLSKFSLSIKNIKNKYFVLWIKFKCLLVYIFGWAVAISNDDFGREWFVYFGEVINPAFL